jgi:hypothetical protein
MVLCDGDAHCECLFTRIFTSKSRFKRQPRLKSRRCAFFWSSSDLPPFLVWETGFPCSDSYSWFTMKKDWLTHTSWCRKSI